LKGKDWLNPMTEEPTRVRPVQIIEPRESVGVWLRDLWNYRQALVALSARDIRGKYKQAVLGVAWAVIQPVVQVGLFTFVFKGVANVETPVAYPMYVLAALLPFNLFQQIVSFGTPAFVTAQGIITKVYFPRLYTVLAGSASSLLNAAIALVLLIGGLIGFDVKPSRMVLLAVPMLVGTILLSVGVASLLGAINARFRDVQHALPLLLAVMMFVSPVLYPLKSMPARVRSLALINPVTGLIDGFRAAITGVPPYSWTLVVASLLSSVVIFGLGVWVFERYQAKLIDVL
jgi:lipopolysaccharide transport system permease protein